MVKTKKSKLKKYVKKSCKKSKLRKLKRTRKNIRKKIRAGSKRLGLGGMKRQRPPSTPQPTTPSEIHTPEVGDDGTPFNTDGRKQAKLEAAAKRAAREAGDLPDGSGTPLDSEGREAADLRAAASGKSQGNLKPRKL